MNSDDLMRIQVKLATIDELTMTVANLRRDLRDLQIQVGALTESQEDLKRQLEQKQSSDND